MNGRSPRSIDELHEMASRPTPAVAETLRGVSGDLLVLGAGGKMGFHLSRMLQRGLAQAGSEARVLAVSRFTSPAATRLFQEFGIATHSIDLSQPDSLDQLPDTELVFFLAGVKFGSSNDPDRLQQINVELPARVARRFSSSRIVALSTGCVYPYVPVSNGGSVECDPVQPLGAYAESCVGRERTFIQSTTPTTLIRLNYSVDLRYGVLVDLAQRILDHRPIDLQMGYVNVIWQGDANAYIILASSLAVSPPAILNVTGRRTLRVRDVASWFGKRFGIDVRFQGEEQETAWLSNSSRCRELFGDPAVSEEELMEWVADWLELGGETLGKPTQFETRDGQY